MVAVVVWVASDNTGDKSGRIVFSSVSHKENMQPVMEKPRYQGVDVHNQPYTIIAERAVQQDANTVTLETLNADMTQQNGKWLALNAASGVLNMQTKQLALAGGVNLFADGGYEFRTDHAHVDIQKGDASGDAHIEGQGPPGTLTADSFSANSHEHVIRFNGSVRMTLYP